MAGVRDIIKGHVGTAALLYTTDGRWLPYYSSGSIPGALTTIDFGPGKVDLFKMYLENFARNRPLFQSQIDVLLHRNPNNFNILTKIRKKEQLLFWTWSPRVIYPHWN